MKHTDQHFELNGPVIFWTKGAGHPNTESTKDALKRDNSFVE